ncbi:DUF1127 domain-containing protein [Flavobacteriaceae bacterium]|nr:DUF1127 domain-containing protein [Flavobacteriaceae bacterium]
MFDKIKEIRETLRRRRNMNETIKALHQLNDLELRDVGIHRTQIDEVARSVIDFHRTVRNITEQESKKDD